MRLPRQRRAHIRLGRDFASSRSPERIMEPAPSQRRLVRGTAAQESDRQGDDVFRPAAPSCLDGKGSGPVPHGIVEVTTAKLLRRSIACIAVSGETFSCWPSFATSACGGQPLLSVLVFEAGEGRSTSGSRACR